MKKDKCSFCGRVIGKMPAVAAPKAIICEDCIELAVEIIRAHHNGELKNNMLMSVIDLGMIDKNKEIGKYKCYFDGSSTGEASCGYVVFDYKGNEIQRETNIPLGNETDNHAEYMGLIYLLSYLLSIKAKEVEIMGDSQMVTNQVAGSWRADNPNIRKLRSDARRLYSKLPKRSLKHIPREDNLSIIKK